MDRGSEDQPLISTFADDAGMQQLLEEFASEMPDAIERMLTHWRRQEIDDLRRSVREIHASGLGHGFAVLSQVAENVEQQIDTTPDDLDAIGRELNHLLELCARVAA